MADPVKISELPVASSVAAGDILPVVDSALTQTRRCTAAQIAAIGGGPPGDGTVTEGKIASGAVTYPKIQNVTGDRVLGRTSGASGVVQEIPCTSWARGLLALANNTDAATYIGNLLSLENPTISGGTLNSSTLNSSTLNNPTFRGNASAAVGNSTAAYPAFFVRAWAFFDGQATPPSIFGSGNVTSVSRAIGSPMTIIGASPPGVTTGYTFVFYTVNFATPMPDTNYAFAGVGSNQLNAELPSLQSGALNLTTSSTFGVGVVTTLNPLVTAVPMPRLSAIYVR